MPAEYWLLLAAIVLVYVVGIGLLAYHSWREERREDRDR